MDKMGNSNGGNGGTGTETEGQAKYLGKKELSEIIFVYTVYYFFMNMKAEELHRDFKDTTGRRLKRVGLFNCIGANVLGMSRNRFNRVTSGKEFNISKKEKEGWEKKFKVDIALFEPDEDKKVLGNDLGGWIGHFKSGKRMQDSKCAEDELGKVLGNINGYIGTPFYSIYFYLCNSRACDPRSNVQTAIDYLKKAGLAEWKGISANEAEKSIKVLEKHYRYLLMKMEIEKMEEEEALKR